MGAEERHHAEPGFRARKLRSRSSATTALPNGRALNWRRRAGLVLAAGSVAATTVYGLGPGGATASSHREAPLVAADPADRQHRPVRVRQSGTAGLRHVRGELAAVLGAQRRTELLPVRHRRPLRHQRRQQRRRQAGRHLPVDVQEHRQARQRHVPLQQRPGDLARRREPAVPPDVHARVIVQRAAVRHPRHRRTGRAVAGRPGLDAGLPGAARRRPSTTSRAAGRATPARPTTRSSSTCASSTCSTAATSARSARTRWPATT